MSFCFVTYLLAFAAVQTGAQFVPAPTDLTSAVGYAGIPVRYKEVPTGICEQDPSVKSYSGYADVDKNQHIFFWFFEARNGDPSEAPLTVWINGGPGSSSMIGLFQENGPCGVDYFGNVYNNPYSWSNASNMLYIDQPTQTGFSYTVPLPGYLNQRTFETVYLRNNTCPKGATQCGTYTYSSVELTANSTAAAAPNFWKTLQGFMGAFPQYSRESFHFTTESYGGHYAPVFSSYIQEQNAKNISGTKHINLETVMIGNGWYDPLIQYQAYYNFTVFPGNTYDYVPYNESMSTMLYNLLYGPGKCVDRMNDCYANGTNAICRDADNFCANYIESFYDIHTGRDEYDSRELERDPFPYGFFGDYLNTPQVQSAIGAFVNFTGGGAVGQAFSSTGDDGREDGTLEDVRSLLSQNVSVVMYAGDADYNCNWLGGQKVAELVNATGFVDAGYVNISTSDNIVHGQVKQAGKFGFVRIYESGHEVPFYQPLAALELFERVINGVDIETGRQSITDTYLTVGTKESTYREGNSTFQWQVVPGNIRYNTTTNEPGTPWTQASRLRKFKP